MSDEWVGFRSIPKSDRNRVIKKRKFEHLVTADAPIVINKFLKKEEFESWFGEVQKFDARQGGRIVFVRNETDYHGAFGQIQIPNVISLVTEYHGEITLKLSQRRKNKVTLIFQKALLATEIEEWVTEVERLHVSLFSELT